MTGPFRDVHLATDRHAVERRPDGAILIRNLVPLSPPRARVTDALVEHAGAAPDRTFVAKRDRDGTWRQLSYGQALRRAERLGAALLARGLSAERPLAILSGNDRDHAALALGALHAGVPYGPVSPAYSGVGGDYARLRDILGILTPGLVFAASADAFGSAIAAAVPADVPVVLGEGRLPDRPSLSIAEFEESGGDPGGLAAAHAAIGPGTIAKFLFTSGSTGLPKAVITTHGMLCANVAQITDAFPFFAESPPVLVDWLPWHHVFGGSHNFDLVLFSGGSLHVDDGRPTPGGIGETVRNLKEIAPTCYLTVPKGFEALVPHLRSDQALRESFFRRLQLTFFAAAGLPQPVWDAMDVVAVEALGARVPMVTGLGSTESAPFALVCAPVHCRSGRVGLPARGVELKLAPVGDKLEARAKGPNITPGYWRNPELTTAAFDEEGFFRFGDALRFVDPARPEIGLYFDGRLNEDFKLTSGVWVSVGPLRARILDAGQPFCRDVAIAGENRGDLRVLLVPDVAACAALAGFSPRAEPAAILGHPAIRAAVAALLRRLADRATGSSNRVEAALILEEPPSIDLNEITDKGSINQRTTLARRAALVEALYGDGPEVIRPEGGAP